MPTDPKGVKLIHVTTVPNSFRWFNNGQISYMRERGFVVEGISSPGKVAITPSERMPVHRVELKRSISPLSDLLAVWRVWGILRRERPAIVHAHTPKAGLVGMLAATLSRTPVRIYHVHGLRFETTTGVKRMLLKATEKLSCLLAHRVLCVSASVRDLLLEGRLCAAGKARVLKKGSVSGIDTEGSFNPDCIDSRIRNCTLERYGIPGSARVVGFVGRVVRDKGLVELVESWRILRPRFSDLHLLIAGRFEKEDPVPHEVERELKEDPRIHLVGYVDDPRDLYLSMDVLVLPTYREGFPVTVLEAGALRVPVVATAVTGCVDAVQDGVTGRLVARGDPAALGEAVAAYLEDPDLRKRHGGAARQFVVRYYSAPTVWEATFREYEQLLENRKARLTALSGRP